MKPARPAPPNLSAGRKWSIWPLLPVSTVLLGFGVISLAWPGWV